jgi:FAD dependent oxidoreductase
MTQADIMERRTKDDSVGLGSYNTDSHHVQRVVGADGFVVNEGDFQVRVSPYAIPYRSLIPKAGECTNLLVPVCMSASHVAYGTVRMEPVYMILGQASGVAAALAVDAKREVQKVDIAKLQAKLTAQKAILSPEGFAPAARGLDPAKLGGIVVDDEQAEKTGIWVHSTSAGPFVGSGYLHDNHEEPGKRKVRFTPKLPQAGAYEVRLFYSPHSNRATNVLVVVHHAGGEQMIRVNQRQAHGEKGFRLGEFRFAAGDSWVEIRNDGADGYVIADAVQWVREREQ